MKTKLPYISLISLKLCKVFDVIYKWVNSAVYCNVWRIKWPSLFLTIQVYMLQTELHKSWNIKQSWNFHQRFYTRYLIQKSKNVRLNQKIIAQKTQNRVPKGNFCQPITQHISWMKILHGFQKFYTILDHADRRFLQLNFKERVS